jgi:hypothetical protein
VVLERLFHKQLQPIVAVANCFQFTSPVQLITDITMLVFMESVYFFIYLFIYYYFPLIRSYCCLSDSATCQENPGDSARMVGLVPSKAPVLPQCLLDDDGDAGDADKGWEDDDNDDTSGNGPTTPSGREIARLREQNRQRAQSCANLAAKVAHLLERLKITEDLLVANNIPLPTAPPPPVVEPPSVTCGKEKTKRFAPCIILL